MNKQTIKINVRGKNGKFDPTSNKKPKDTRFKVLATGSNRYQNKIKIKDTIFKIKESAGNNMIIASRANTIGADNYINNICISLGLQYGEFPTYDNPYHGGCIMPKFRFNKEGSAERHYYIRNNDAVKWADLVLIFIGDEEENKDIERLIKLCESNNKDYFVL